MIAISTASFWSTVGGLKRNGECLISSDRVLSQGVAIGSEVVFTQGTGDLDDTFAVKRYTVVGTVHIPYYITSAAIESSSLGSGVVQQDRKSVV